MNDKPSVEDWNSMVLDLVQALLGAISPNFRMVSLHHEGQKWIVRIILEEENEDDYEEITDFSAELEAILPCNTDFQVDVVVSKGAIPSLSLPERVVFLRRDTRIPATSS